MDSSSKTKLINLALLLSLSLPVVAQIFGFATNKIAAISSLVAGAILTIFYREVAAERFKINKETKNRHLREFFAGETESGDRIIFLVAGIFFLFFGLFLTMAVFG